MRRSRSKKPEYLKQYFREKDGVWVNQYRRNGKLIRLPDGRNFTDEFWKAYYAAEAGILRTPVVIKTGTVDAALVAFYGSTTFRAGAVNSQLNMRSQLEHHFRPEYGGAILATMRADHIADLVSERFAVSPGNGRNILRALRKFTQFCVQKRLLTFDPAAGYKAPKGGPKSDGYHTWTEEDVAQFEAFWPDDSLPRRALALHLYTAGAACDVVKFGWQYIRDGKLRYSRQKTKVPCVIPIHPTLRRILKAVPRDNLTFLLNSQGRPFPASSYSAKFRIWCNKAGLPHCSSHGLRKACCRRLAEAGVRPHDIMAISGHKTLAEVQRYCDAYDREAGADRAMQAIS